MKWKVLLNVSQGRADYFCTTGLWTPSETGSSTSVMEFMAEYIHSTSWTSTSNASINVYYAYYAVNTSSNKVTTCDHFNKAYTAASDGYGITITSVNENILYPYELYILEDCYTS